MSREDNHHCHARGCDTKVPPAMHMCRKHWRMVPRGQQRALLAHYRAGQEDDMQPSPAYLRAAADCVKAVARLEGYDDAAIAKEANSYYRWAEMIEEAEETH